MLAYEHCDALARELFIEKIGWNSSARRHFPELVVGRRLVAEPYANAVTLVVRRHELVEPRGRTNAYGQNTRCKRVERASMTNPTLAKDPSATIDDIMRRHAFRLVNANYEGKAGRAALHLRFPTIR